MGQDVARSRISLPLKLAYTAFMLVLVPCYWYQYGPANFLWFCDIALFVTLAAIWLESPFLASMQAVAIVLPQLLWVLDFFCGLVAGVFPVKMTEYMFDPSIPPFFRGLSLFHGWLPFVLIYLVWRLGYDRRACLAQTMLAIVVLVACYTFADVFRENDPDFDFNLNKVMGWEEKKTQDWVAPQLWLLLVMAAYPLLVYLPSHLVMQKLFPTPEEAADRARSHLA